MNKDLHLLGQLTTELLLNAEDCGNWLATSGTLISDDVEMLKRVEAFCQEPKVWAVTQDEVVDCAEHAHEPEIFLSYEDALKCFNDLSWLAEHDFGSRGWDKDEYTDVNGGLNFDMWDSNNGFVVSHYSVALESVTIK